MLLSRGQHRGKVYHLPGAEPVSLEQVFAAAISSGSNAESSGSSTGSSGSNASNCSGSSKNPALSDGLTADSVPLRRGMIQHKPLIGGLREEYL